MKTVFATFVMVAMATFTTYAQTTTVTDEELMKYATVMDSINELSATVRAMLTKMVKEDSVISASRYSELIQAINDPTKLSELRATPEEIEFINRLAEKREQETARINEIFQRLAKEVVTTQVFNKVKKELMNDAALKARYDSLMVELGKDDPTDH